MKGQLVRVGKFIGVITHLEGEGEVPEDHVGIWYGQHNEEGMPLIRTVPKEYAAIIDDVIFYH